MACCHSMIYLFRKFAKGKMFVVYMCSENLTTRFLECAILDRNTPSQNADCASKMVI